MTEYTREQLDIIVPMLKKMLKDNLAPSISDDLNTIVCNTWLCAPCSWYCLDTDTYRHEWRVMGKGEKLLAAPEKYLRSAVAVQHANKDTAHAYAAGLRRAMEIAADCDELETVRIALKDEAEKAKPS